MQIQNLSWLSKDEVKNELVSRVTNVIKYNELTVFPSWIRDYENYLWYNGRTYYKLKSMWLERMYYHYGKTDLIRRGVYGFYGMLDKLRIYKPKATTYIWKEYSKYAKNYENFILYTATRKENKSEIDKVMHEWLLTGNGFFKVTFARQNKKINKWFTKRKWVITAENEVQSIQFPYIKYVSCFDVILDPTGLNRIIGDKKLMTVQQISQFFDISEARLKELWWTEATDENPAVPMQRLFRYDWNRVKDIRAFENQLVWADCIDKCEEEIGSEKNWYSVADGIYEVIDLFVDVVEDWMYETYRAVIINWSLEIREKSDYPFDWSPIIHTKFIDVPWSVYWIGIGELWASYQNRADRAEMTKMVTQSVVANPTIIETQNLKPWQKQEPKKMFKWEWRSIIPWNDTANNWYDILRLIDPNVIPLMSDELNRIEQRFFALIGLNNLIEWWAWPVEQTSAWVTAKSNSAKLWVYITNLSESLSEVYEKCALLMKAHWTDIELDNMDWDSETTTKIKIKDLYNGYKITFNTEDIFWTRQQKAEQLTAVLQYASKYMELDPIEWRMMLKDVVKELIKNADSWITMRSQTEIEDEMKKEIETEKRIMEIRAEAMPPQWEDIKEDIKIIVSLKDILQMTPQQQAIMLEKYFNIPMDTGAEQWTQQQLAQAELQDKWQQNEVNPFEMLVQ